MHENLGKILRQARTASGLSIEDVASRAKIPKPVIEALEAEDFGFFNSPLYARSFLKQYGEYIGADIEPWLADFIPAVMIDSDSVESILTSPDAGTDPPNSKDHENNPNAIWGPVWIFLITVAIIWGGVEIYEKLDSEHGQSEEHSSPEVSDPDNAETNPSPEVPAPQPRENESMELDPPRRAMIVEPAPE